MSAHTDHHGKTDPPRLKLPQIVNHLERSRSNPDPRLSIAENLAVPLVRYAWSELSHSLSPRFLRLLTCGATEALRRSLLSRLVSTGSQAIEFSYWTFRMTPGVIAKSVNRVPKGCLTKEFLSCSVETEILLLFRRHPALGRLWAEQVGRWCRFMAGFLRDAYCFTGLQEVCGFTKGGSIREIKPDVSDLHSGNRSVIRVRFANGQTWFYKPRSGNKEKHLFDLLGYLNRRGFRAPFQTVRIVCGTNHCWMAAVTWRSCRTTKEAGTFFFRAGALLYLLHFLRGVDFHAANLIAHGSQPMITDCETLLHPKTKLPTRFHVEARSILRVGMLPVRRSTKPSSDSISALGRRTRGTHSVILKGKIVAAADFLEEVIDGFSEMHNLFVRIGQKSAGLASILSKLRASPGRMILRPTMHYQALLKRSLEPPKLQSCAIRTAFLREACCQDSVSARQRETEVAALRRGDTPVFYTSPDYPRRLSSDHVTDAIRIIRQALSRDSSQVGRVDPG